MGAKFRQPPYSVAEANIISKSITANGTYNASSDSADGYNPVTVNVPESVIVSKSITANGTYNASSDSADGYNPVTVNVPTGVPKMTRAEWDNLTTAEKQALQYVAIQDSNSGFMRGDLVYGADYIPKGIYLPYSNEDDVICEAYVNNFSPSDLSWGVGDNPIILTGHVSVDATENAVSIPTATSGILAYVNLLSTNTPYTAYVVMRASNPGAYSRLISNMITRSSGGGIMLYGSTITVSTWASDDSLGVSSANYFVGVLQFGGSGVAKGGILNNIINKSPSNSGQYITIGRTDIDPSTINAEPCDTFVRYLGVVDGIDSADAIANNMSHLNNAFIA